MAQGGGGGGGKAMLWIGLGCGGFALLAICGLTGLGVWMYGMRSSEAVAAGPVGPTPEAQPVPGPAPMPASFRKVSGSGWSFGVPDRWVDIPAPPPATVAVRAPTPTGGFHPNVNLVSEPFYGGDGAAYGRANLTQVRAIANVVDHRRRTVGGQAAYDIEAKWPGNFPPSHTVQRYMVSGSTGYVLTCSGGMGSFESVRRDCEQVLDTFRLQ